MAKHPVTFSYIVFYMLFHPDTWQGVIGVATAILIGPRIMPEGYSAAARTMVYIMLAALGYTASRPLGRWIAGKLKKMVLGDKIQ